jgi:hypothetical protein
MPVNNSRPEAEGTPRVGAMRRLQQLSRLDPANVAWTHRARERQSASSTPLHAMDAGNSAAEREIALLNRCLGYPLEGEASSQCRAAR